MTVICFVSDAVVDVTTLPDFSVAYDRPRPKRKAAFDELKGTLQGYFRGKQNMEVIRHDHEFVQQVLSLCAIAIQCLDKESR
jgi:hypothetical protein